MVQFIKGEQDMDIHALLITCGIIFLFVALMHLLRLFFKVEVIIGGKRIPFWVSAIGFFLPLSLAIWVFISISA
jgi:hypothetical protein